ncbi:MAG: zinc-ribbon domain-containing protein, partial [Deltaproteobacteria bacterium]|nr:zinc-ribbon domain-containing protein [Deltaproteobacteria bacterium]
MIIQCENCKRNFRLEDSRINPPGSSVRCSKCGHIFFVSKTKELSNEATLEISQETPLFEDLKEEIVTEEKSNDYPEKEEPLSGSSSDLTQAELSIRKDTDETDSDIVDLPTEHDQSLEELIDKTQTLEIQETDSHINDINIDQEPADSTPASPELFEAEDGEEDFGESHNRSHNRKTSYASSETIVQKSGAGIFAKIIYTLITITALFVIFIASLV